MASILFSTKFMSFRMNLSFFVAFTFVFRKLAFSCVFCMITNIEEILLGAHGSLVHIIY